MSHVDTTSPVTHVSLCAGYGGIDIGLNRAVGNLRTIAFSEIEAFACANLVSKMEAGLLDAAPIWTNLKTFPWSEFRDRVDILSGGYPCQPFSAAGKRLGTEDPRHLWPYIADGIAAMRPSVCFFENVEGHISLGLPDVIEDLAGMGYRTTWGIFSASEVGAPHQRKRVFIMAHRNVAGLERNITKLPHSSGREKPVRSASSSCRSSGEGGLAYSMCNGGREGWEIQQRADGSISVGNGESWGTWPSRPGQPQFSWEPPRVVGNSSDKRKLNEAEQDESEAGSLLDRASEGAVVENTKLLGRRGRDHGDEGGMRGEIQTAGSCGGMGDASTPRRSQHCAGLDQSQDDPSTTYGDEEQRQTQPSLGGNPHGTPRGVGHAELYVSCDNRTDELRLLGNGVVPATAELAFRTLWEELTWK